MGYTRENIIEMCINAAKDVDTFYKQKFINYRGKTEDTGELYNEVVAEYVCNNIRKLDAITMITRGASYCTVGHDGKYNKHSNRVEEITAMCMYNQCKAGDEFDYIGKIIDYQTPLKNIKSDEAGKIDLLSIKDDTMYILELKKIDSDETMLRCVLEGYTYLKTVDTRKLIDDFNLNGKINKVVASPFVFKNKCQYAEMQESRPWLKKLITILDTKPFYITQMIDRYYVEDK